MCAGGADGFVGVGGTVTDGLVGDETVSDMSALHRVRSKAGKLFFLALDQND